MFVKRLAVGQLGANCYIVADESSKEAVVIDPGAEGGRILDSIKDNNFKLKYVINTHGHVDHIGANLKLLEETDAKLLIHKDDEDYLQNPNLNLAAFVGGLNKQEFGKADLLLEDGSKIECGKLLLEVIHTPGHTPGGITLKVEDGLFTGDTVFALGVGRTDFPNGSMQQLKESINRLLKFDSDLKVYPGHGGTTTIARLKTSNPYL